MLTWSSHPHVVGTLVAVGVRGVYSLQSVGPVWVLHGVGHDELPLLSLPLAGKWFNTLDSAKTYTQGLDRVSAPEVQVGGE